MSELRHLDTLTPAPKARSEHPGSPWGASDDDEAAPGKKSAKVRPL